MHNVPGRILWKSLRSFVDAARARSPSLHAPPCFRLRVMSSLTIRPNSGGRSDRSLPVNLPVLGFRWQRTHSSEANFSSRSTALRGLRRAARPVPKTGQPVELDVQRKARH